jgi:reactive intermediate/imine deaminase
MIKEAIKIDEKIVPKPLGAYSHAIKAGNFLFISGQGARDAQTNEEVGVNLDGNGKIISYDIEAQTHACIKNVSTVLAAANLSLKDLVDITVFLADINDFAKYNKIYNQYFSNLAAPARTTIQAAALPGKNFIEIKAIAIFPSD